MIVLKYSIFILYNILAWILVMYIKDWEDRRRKMKHFPKAKLVW